MRSKPTGSNFRKRNCCWVSWAASVKIAKKPRAEHPFAAFLSRTMRGRDASRVVCFSLSLSLLSPLSLSFSLSFYFCLSLSLVLSLSLLFFSLSLSPLSLSLSLCSLSLSLLSSLFSLSLFSLSLYLSLLLSLSLSLLSRSLQRLNCQPLLAGSKPPNPTTNLPTRLSVLSGREPPSEVKHQLVLQ